MCDCEHDAPYSGIMIEIKENYSWVCKWDRKVKRSYNERIGSAMGRIHVCFYALFVLLACDDP
jgi:hypothetical protein